MEMVHFIPPSQRRLALLASQADSAPVLIHGASGTGKGGIARWIHQHGARAALPFVIANRDRPLHEQIPHAQGGTLVIDEIGEWPLGEQRVLLDFLQTRTLAHPANPSMRMLANVRIMATTSQALDGRAQGGLFNASLLEKLSAFRMEMPSLAKRDQEFEDIVLGLLGEITREVHKEHLRTLTAEAWERLKAYDWPGNLRELRNVMRLAVLKARGDDVEEVDLPEFGHDHLDFRSTREEFERIYILELLRTFDGKVEDACKGTKMDQGTLLSKMKKYGIDSLNPTPEL